jgi:predicted phage-related endonuclease
MTTQTLWRKPASESEWLHWRTGVVTSTETPALFNASPYLTKFELWHNKSGTQVTEFIESERTKWGRRLEAPIAAGIAEDQGWQIEPLKSFAVMEDIRAGSSFDYLANAPNRGGGILEIKNVDGLEFLRKWTVTDDGQIEAPAHIEIQLQHQLMVSGYPWGCIGAMVGGNRPTLIIRERDDAVCQAIRRAIQEFWRTVDAKEPPDPNFAEDADAIAKLYAYAEPGKMLDASGREDIRVLCDTYKTAAADEKDAASRKDAAKAELLTLIGDAEKVTADGYKISAGLVGPAEIAYTRAGYRLVKITKLKEKV